MQQIIRLAEDLRTDAGRVLIHCEAGVSRSTAAALIMHACWLGPGCEREAMQRVLAQRPIAIPNRRMVELADRLLDWGGRLVECSAKLFVRVEFMVDAHERLVAAVAEENSAEVRCLIENGIDLNVRVDQGASILFAAILQGDEILIRLMLEHGADPNLIAEEPAATIYTEKPLDLARQARFLMDWDKYDPIVKLLEAFGATDFDGQVESESDAKLVEARARHWQAQKTAPKQ